MPEVTAALVKSLRERTGAGMMDCKRALVETGGDIEAGVDRLRQQGLAAAAQKAGRVASEGLVGIAADDRRAAVVEVNAETDFVARNEAFQSAVRAIATVALTTGNDLDALAAANYPGGSGSVADELTRLVAVIGENIQLRRAAALSVDHGVVGTYVHGLVAPNVGQIGVLAALDSRADAGTLAALAKQIAMHVAAARPEATGIEDVDPAALERERKVIAGQARTSGKPENIIEKMIEGRLRKYYEEVVLLEQVYVIDGSTRVSKVLAAAGEDVGAPVRVAGFVRFALGEGIEKEETDFAADVAAQLA